ncbi:MAG: multidrug effflux MFS transporter [Pseudoruegeria sp.]
MIRKPLREKEFIALCALMMAMIAIAIDAMLPALSEIGHTLSPDTPERAPLVIAFYVFGMGVGTLFVGPMSDTLGRRPVLLFGTGLYCVAAIICWRTDSFEMLLLARILQGVGVAGPRVVTQAIIRDLYHGEKMAKVVSFMMMIFVLVPAVAPAMGQLVMINFGWRAIFLTFVLFALILGTWFFIRQPETLAVDQRRPFTFTSFISASREMMSIHMVRVSIIVQTLTLGMLFSMISLVQPMFEFTYGRGDDFAMWFAGLALIAGTANLVNARLVERLGMRPLATFGYLIQCVFAALALILAVTGQLHFLLFVVWILSLFYMVGFTLGNLNALAMEPLGHIAGIASSVIGAVSTIGGAIVSAVVGITFTGTVTPLAVTCLLCSVSAVVLMRSIANEERVKLT